jgi:hypothetical protein
MGDRGTAPEDEKAQGSPYADAQYRTYKLEDGTFAVSVTAVGVLPTKVMGFATQGAANLWIVNHKATVTVGKARTQDDLKRVDQRIAEARERLDQQRVLILKLLASGHDTTDAEALYRTMRGALEYFESGRRKIEDELFAKNPPRPK